MMFAFDPIVFAFSSGRKAKRIMCVKHDEGFNTCLGSMNLRISQVVSTARRYGLW
jgi:hypothetical protein